MAPSPEDDNTPKAPDKSEKTKPEKQSSQESNKEKTKDTKTLNNLNDGELKALLDEAITYKNPKDREGKSKLFKDLLSEAEANERNARAASAGGSELVRYCNPSAKRKGNRRKPSSISENMIHSGSLDNLAKEELYGTTSHNYRAKKNVSTRQREGGSLPCNVNSTALSTSFLEEAHRKKENRKKEKDYTEIEMEVESEHESLLKHDVLAKSYHDPAPIEMVTANPINYTSKASFKVNGSGVDEPIQLDLEHRSEKKSYEHEPIHTKVVQSQYSIYIPQYCPGRMVEEKKVDENGNAVHQNNPGAKARKKKTTDKNVVVVTSEKVEGHRSDIIDNVDKLVEYIDGKNQDGTISNNKPRCVTKSKQLHKHTSEDGHSNKKLRAHSSKSKDVRSDLKKSNSMGEISSTKLDDFSFSNDYQDNKVVLRSSKSNTVDWPRERRSWGNVEPPPIQTLYINTSVENLEMAEFRVVTKKKKSKKRRNSVSSSRRQVNCDSSTKPTQNRAPSPDLRRKYSEKSNDSSDVDSVHSLPIDTQHLKSPNLHNENLNAPISYADIAKNADKPKDKKLSPEKEKVPNKEFSPVLKLDIEFKESKIKSPPVLINNLILNKPIPAIETLNKSHVNCPTILNSSVNPSVNINNNTGTVNNNNNNVKNLPPDVHNIKNFPAIVPPANNKVFHTTMNFLNQQIGHIEKSNNNKNVSNKSQKNCTNSVNNNVNKSKNNVQKLNSTSATNNLQCSIQTDLSIIQANEKESIQFNAQMLPPDIPDVQTIEKMHFMGQQLKNQQSSSALVGTDKPILPTMMSSLPSVGLVHPPPPQINSVLVNNNNINNAYMLNDCDNNGDKRTNASTINLNNNIGSADRPPVVILSGVGNKEVQGLVFGFDINEKLLSEDVCNDFISRYIVPEYFSSTSHNHEKIVNFIGSAWDDTTMDFSNGKVQYYKEES